MVDIKTIKEENKLWHQEHTVWMKELDQWRHETRRMVALLCLVERALPEHSVMLKKHESLIIDHEKHMQCDGCGLDERCFPTCPTYKSPQQIEELHQKLANSHASSKHQHQVIKQTFAEEMEKFRSLVKNLLKEDFSA